MSTVSEWGLVEASIISSGPAVIGALLAVCWKMLGQRIAGIDKRVDETNKNVGIHFSKINDLRVDMTAIETNVSNHTDKFEELVDSIGSLREELNSHLRRIEDKLDNFRERRGL